MRRNPDHPKPCPASVGHLRPVADAARLAAEKPPRRTSAFAVGAQANAVTAVTAATIASSIFIVCPLLELIAT
jgi:hypothetical protein